MLALNSTVDSGRFRIISQLGKGGSGICYLAQDLAAPLAPSTSAQQPPRYYAIKAIPVPRSGSHAESSLLREVRLHQLVSRNERIVPLRRALVEQDHYLLIMDYFPGGDLFKQITQQHRYFLNDALITSIFLQILDAVEHCHAQGVYHRDLKPENILCSADGNRVFLADFGLATRSTVSDDLGVGSGYYMSPECNVGPSYSTQANDIWSLGVILSNLCYGRNPWACAMPQSDPTFSAFMNDRDYLTQILPVPSEVNTLFKGIFELDPSKRWSLDRIRQTVLHLHERRVSWVVSDENKCRGREARNVLAGLRASAKPQPQQHHSAAPRVVVAAPAPVALPAQDNKEKRGLRLMLNKLNPVSRESSGILSPALPSPALSDASSSDDAEDTSSMPPTPPAQYFQRANAQASSVLNPMSKKARGSTPNRSEFPFFGIRS